MDVGRKTSWLSHSRPNRQSAKPTNAGEPSANGCTTEQISWTKPGSVSSAERAPPPMIGSASKRGRKSGTRQQNRGGQSVRSRADNAGSWVANRRLARQCSSGDLVESFRGALPENICRVDETRVQLGARLGACVCAPVRAAAPRKKTADEAGDGRCYFRCDSMQPRCQVRGNREDLFGVAADGGPDD